MRRPISSSSYSNELLNLVLTPQFRHIQLLFICFEWSAAHNTHITHQQRHTPPGCRSAMSAHYFCMRHWFSKVTASLPTQSTTNTPLYHPFSKDFGLIFGHVQGVGAAFPSQDQRKLRDRRKYPEKRWATLKCWGRGAGWGRQGKRARHREASSPVSNQSCLGIVIKTLGFPTMLNYSFIGQSLYWLSKMSSTKRALTETWSQ